MHGEQRAAVRTIHLRGPRQAVPLLELQAAGVPVSTDVVQVAPKTQINVYCVEESENWPFMKVLKEQGPWPVPGRLSH